jgi:hypothetical protein
MFCEHANLIIFPRFADECRVLFCKIYMLAFPVSMELLVADIWQFLEKERHFEILLRSHAEELI